MIYNMDQMCDRVGCHCDGATMICSIGGTRFYNAAINAIFNDICTSRCRCEPEYREPPEPVSASDSDTDTTWSSVGDSDYSDDSIDDHWAHNRAIVRAHYRHGRRIGDVSPPPPGCVASRLQHCDSCLAGPSAGWTLKSADCCPQFSLKQISPQEAFTEFGLSISTLVASHAKIGVCMKA